MDSRIRETIEHLRGRWASVDTATLRHAFVLLARGGPVTATQLADAAGQPVSEVEKALQTDRVTLDGQGRLVELFGVTIQTGRHRIELEDRDLYSCCALVAHTVPHLLVRPVTIESLDPVSGETVRVGTSTETVESVSPNTAMASFVASERREVLSDPGSHFCYHVQHFASPASAGRFVGQDPRRFVVEIRDLQEAAREVYRTLWSA
jgi:alkylmercury lyase